jgi:hypothetical protein
MTEEAVKAVVAKICTAFETRQYMNFVDLFTADAIFETPFNINGKTRLDVKPAIKAHFEVISQSAWTKLIQTNKVSANSHFCGADGTVTVEYIMEAKVVETGEMFTMPSSVAIIQIVDGNIVHYKDFPNTLGISKTAGVLPQLAANWIKE